VNLVIVAIDPANLRLIVHGNEIGVLFPHDESSFGAEHVLLPPDLPEV
jgi:hypothetical protein